MGLQSHWDKVYTTRRLNEVSWYQPRPQVSLDFINELNIPKDAAIIDVGGGDSFLVDHLLAAGFRDITVLDISEAAINRAKTRLGSVADIVTWIVCDVTEFVPEKTYDFWHDRAAFHFLTSGEEIKKYLAVASSSLPVDGKIVIGSFSETGPGKCSGLPVKQYSEDSLTAIVQKWFQKIKCIHSDHITPSNTVQNFLFCSFKKSNRNYGLS